MRDCKHLNIQISEEEPVPGCINDVVITFKETCPDCGQVTYGWEISDRDGEFIDGDGGFATREEAASDAAKADDSAVCSPDYFD